MHEVIDDEIRREPREVIPIAALVFEFAHLRLADETGPQRRIGKGARVDQLPNLPVLNALHHFPEALLVSSLKTNGHLQILALCFFGSRQHAPHTGSLHGDGLLEKDMFAQSHGFLEVRRAKGARRREDHHIGCGDRVPVGVEACELPVRRNIDLFGPLGLEALQSDRQLIGKKIGDRDELRAVARGEGLIRGSRAAATATDERELQWFGRRLAAADRRESERGGSRERGGCAGDERAAIEGG